MIFALNFIQISFLSSTCPFIFICKAQHARAVLKHLFAHRDENPDENPTSVSSSLTSTTSMQSIMLGFEKLLDEKFLKWTQEMSKTYTLSPNVAPASSHVAPTSTSSASSYVASQYSTFENAQRFLKEIMNQSFSVMTNPNEYQTVTSAMIHTDIVALNAVVKSVQKYRKDKSDYWLVPVVLTPNDIKTGNFIHDFRAEGSKSITFIGFIANIEDSVFLGLNHHYMSDDIAIFRTYIFYINQPGDDNEESYSKIQTCRGVIFHDFYQILFLLHNVKPCKIRHFVEIDDILMHDEKAEKKNLPNLPETVKLQSKLRGGTATKYSTVNLFRPNPGLSVNIQALTFVMAVVLSDTSIKDSHLSFLANFFKYFKSLSIPDEEAEKIEKAKEIEKAEQIFFIFCLSELGSNGQFYPVKKDTLLMAPKELADAFVQNVQSGQDDIITRMVAVTEYFDQFGEYLSVLCPCVNCFVCQIYICFLEC